MTQPPAELPRGMPSVRCAQCGREVPRSAAQSAESRDYMLYFCGLDCYEAWARRAPGASGRGPDRSD